MPKQTSNSPSSNTPQPSTTSDALLPLSLLHLTDAGVKLVQPLVRMLENPSQHADKALELLQQPQDLKALAFDIVLVRSLLQGNTPDGPREQNSFSSESKVPKLTEVQKEKIATRLIQLREHTDLTKTERIQKTWTEFSKKIPNLTIGQIRAHEAHVTMRSRSQLR